MVVHKKGRESTWLLSVKFGLNPTHTLLNNPNLCPPFIYYQWPVMFLKLAKM